MYVCAGATLVVNTFSSVSFFDPLGRHVRTNSVRQFGRGGRHWIRGISADCNTLVVQTYTAPPRQRGTVGVHYTTLAWSRLDQWSSSRITSMPTIVLYSRVSLGGIRHNVLATVPWGQLSSWTMVDSLVSTGLTSRPEVRIYARGEGLIRIVRWRQEATTIGPDERRRNADKRDRCLLRFVPLHDLMPPISEYPELPKNKRLSNALLSDREGTCGSVPSNVLLLACLHSSSSDESCGRAVVLAARSGHGGYSITWDAFLEPWVYPRGSTSSPLNEAS